MHVSLTQSVRLAVVPRTISSSAGQLNVTPLVGQVNVLPPVPSCLMRSQQYPPLAGVPLMASVRFPPIVSSFSESCSQARVTVAPSVIVCAEGALLAAIVIVPAPFVIVTPEPSVNVALTNVPPDVLPINTCPFVKLVWPVPPWPTVIVVASVSIVALEFGRVKSLMDVVGPVNLTNSLPVLPERTSRTLPITHT